MTLIGRKILLTNTDASGNPTLDFPITSIECVEGGASQEDLDTNLQTLQIQLNSLSGLVNTLQVQLEACVTNFNGITDYIVESYRSGTEWYELYKSGMIRQGGYATTSNITFPRAFADMNYTLLTGSNRKGTSTSGNFNYITSWSTTGFVHHLDSSQQVWWEAYGKAA